MPENIRKLRRIRSIDEHHVTARIQTPKGPMEGQIIPPPAGETAEDHALSLKDLGHEVQVVKLEGESQQTRIFVPKKPTENPAGDVQP